MAYEVPVAGPARTSPSFARSTTRSVGKERCRSGRASSKVAKRDGSRKMICALESLIWCASSRGELVVRGCYKSDLLCNVGRADGEAGGQAAENSSCPFQAIDAPEGSDIATAKAEIAEATGQTEGAVLDISTSQNTTVKTINVCRQGRVECRQWPTLLWEEVVENRALREVRRWIVRLEDDAARHGATRELESRQFSFDHIYRRPLRPMEFFDSVSAIIG